MADQVKPGGGGGGSLRSGGLGGAPPAFVKGPTPDAPVAGALAASVGARASLHEILAGVRAGNVPQERAQFRMLLLSNPNYFGTLEGSELAPVVAIKGNTTYEELQCVGYEPQLEVLEGVVLIKQDSGYLGGICTTGSVEYVRFYLSTDGGSTWVDQGQASFAVHDIPGDKPLEYAVSLSVDPARTWCFFENLIKVRAILSWNDPPPANTPSFSPVWGNVVDVDIQVDPFKLIILGDILKEAKLQLPDNLANLVDLEMEIPGPPPKKLDALELHTLYAKSDVPPHRYLLETVQEHLVSTGILEAPAAAQVAGQAGLATKAPGSLFQLVDVDLSKLLGAVFDTFGNTTYEGLDCVGLNRVTDTLEAALTVKLSSGYSGDLCTAGSNEYVAFWVDWGAGWEYAGTSSVNVHDIQGIPPGGLHYAVALPISLAAHRRPCDSGAQVVKARAILSWQTTPSTLDPEYEPTWGNRIDTLVEIAPGPDVQPGTHAPNIETVGHVDVLYIDPTTGLATGPSTGGFSVLDSPFGGAILLTGHIAYPPDSYLGGAAPLQYRVWAFSGGSWQKLTYSFGVTVHRLHNGTWLPGLAVTQTADADGWYDYLEDTEGAFRRTVAENVLHIWYTNPSMNDLGYVLIEARDSANPMGPHWWSNWVTLQLDNLPPQSDLVITSGGGACADFDIGDLIEGTYSVSDQGNHFGAFHLYVEPSPQADTGQLTVDPAPSGPPVVVGPVAPPNISRSYTGLPGGVPTIGESGTWSLDTSQMPRCGYVVRMDAWDRTNVNSSGPGWWATPITVGLCLREKEE
jgi:hypothetical protein